VQWSCEARPSSTASWTRRASSRSSSAWPERTATSPTSATAPTAGVSITPEEAPERFGFLAGFAGADNPTSSELTRQRTGWNPTHPGLIADIENGHYFA